MHWRSRALLIVAPLLVAGIVIARNDAPRPAGAAEHGALRVENWPAIRDSIAISIDAPAKLQQIDAAYAITRSGDRIPIRNFVIDITVFTDFQCPDCRQLDSAIGVLSRPWLVTRHIIHLPDKRHQHAMDAALALECADADGQGLEMHDALFRAQRDFGTRSWASIAAEAFVEDTMVFARCMNDERPEARIQAGLELARRLGIDAPPAVVVNGWLVSPPTAARVDSAVRNIVDKKSPP